MRRCVPAFLVLALLPVAARAQSIHLPAEIRVEPGRLAAVLLDWDGDDVRWTTALELDVFREYDPDPKRIRLRILSAKPGRYKLSAIVCKDKRLSDFAECIVIVGDPGPGPGPGPGPEPYDPLLMALRQAYSAEADTQKLSQLNQLAALYRQASNLAVNRTDLTTWGALWDVMSDSAKSLGLSDKILKVQEVVANELKASLPTSRNAPFDPSGRTRAQTTFLRVADVLGKVVQGGGL